MRGTGDFGANEAPENFREMILFMNPNGDTPLTALMGKTKTESTNDPRIHWFGEPQNIVRLQLNDASDMADSDTAVVVDSVDPTSTTMDGLYGSALNLKVGDLLLVEPATDLATIASEIVEVAAVASATAFTITRGAAGTTAAIILDDAFFTLMGSAYEEGSDAANAASRNPIEFTNYAQIWKDTYKLTKTVVAMGGSAFRTGDPTKLDKKRKSFDHARALELSLMWGRAHTETGAGGEPRRFMGGLREMIPASRTTIFGSSPTVATLTDAIYKVFDFSSPAGDERIMMGGNGFSNVVNNLASGGGTIQFDEIVEVYGMRLQRWILPQGTLYFKRHPLMSQHPTLTNDAFIIDASAMKWRPLRDTHSTDVIQTAGKDAEEGQWLTESSFELMNGGVTCGYLGNTAV